MQVCDVVIFLKQEGALSKTYQYGMVREVKRGMDGLIWKAKIKYRNHENNDRFTWQSDRQLVIINPADELNLMEELSMVTDYVVYKFVDQSEGCPSMY